MTSKATKLLVVDDDARLRGLLEKFLTEHGYGVDSAKDAAEARTKLKRSHYDLIVLDVMMPGESGTELAQKLREEGTEDYTDIPILMLTALSEVDDRIAGLECGADDYLPKPFEPRELVLRIQRILERTQQRIPPLETASSNAPLVFGPLSYTIAKRTLAREGTGPIHLTSAESDLLHIFALSPREALSRFELAERAGVSLSPRTIDVQITRLRKKIEDDPKQPKYLRTVRHKGYALWPD